MYEVAVGNLYASAANVKSKEERGIPLCALGLDRRCL